MLWLFRPFDEGMQGIPEAVWRVEKTETERQMGEGDQQEIIEQQIKEKETIGEGKEGREDAKEVEDAMVAFLEALNGEQFKVQEINERTFQKVF